MAWLQYVVASLFLLLGAGCVFLVIVQMPGAWIMLAIALVIEAADRFYMPEGDRQTFEWWVLGVAAALLVIGEIVEFIAGVEGTRRGGGSKRGMIGALAGGITGAFVLTPLLFFIPAFGTLVGAVLGTFLGALIGELSGEQASLRGSVKPAWGATLGRVVGTLGKVSVALVAWLMLAVSAFW